MGVRFSSRQALKQAQNFAKFFVRKTVCCAVALSLIGCEKPLEPQVLTPSEKSETVLNRVFFGSEWQLDPHHVKNMAESALLRDLLVGLMTVDRHGNVQPALARHFFSEEGKKWLFVLDENARWSNGEAVSADDIVASWQRLFDPHHPSPWASYLADIQVENAQLILDNEVPLSELGVRALSHNTLEITLETPDLQFPNKLAHIALTPTYQGKKPENFIISNGAYRLVDVDKHKATLHAEKEVNQFQTVVYHLAAEHHQLQDFDLVENPKVEDRYIFRLPRLCTYFYEFNFNDPVVGQKAVRQAIRSMINVPELSYGLGIPLHSALPQTLRRNQDRLPFSGNAESLLAQQGVDYRTPLFFTLTIAQDEQQHFIANRFIRQLSQSDLFRIRLREVAMPEWETHREQQHFQIMPRTRCAAYDDPLPFLQMFHSQSPENKSGYGNELVDQWLDELNTGILATSERDKYIANIIHRISEEVVILPLFQYQRKIAIDFDLRGIDPHNDSGIVYSKDLFRKANKDKQ